LEALTAAEAAETETSGVAAFAGIRHAEAVNIVATIRHDGAVVAISRPQLVSIFAPDEKIDV
jgi:hypothetical protein